jgi:hypothetical protein
VFSLKRIEKHVRDADVSRISRGADVNAVDNKGNTPLHEVMKGKMLRKRYENGELEPLPTGFPKIARDELIQVLLDAGASMDQTNGAGQTPGQVLHCILEEQERLKQKDEARRARRGRHSSIGQGRGRVVAYVNSGY